MIENINLFNSDTLERVFPGKRNICIIGNGPINSKDFKHIENADIVVRFNDWNRRRTYDKRTGTRCDVLFTQYDAAPKIDGDFSKPKCVIIAIPHPFKSQRISKITNDLWNDVDVNMVNPYINEECCRSLKLDSFGNKHPIGTVGFSFIYHCSRFMPSDYKFYICGFTCKFDYGTKRFDGVFITDRKENSRQNHCYINEFWWLHDNLLDHEQFQFSPSFHHIVKMTKNADKCFKRFNDVDYVINKIIDGPPFAFVRYGDYEIRAIISNNKVGPNSKSWLMDPTNEKDEKIRNELRQSYTYSDPDKNFIVGWHPKFELPNDISNHVVNATIFGNENYNHILDKLVFSEFPKRKTVLVCNAQCDPSKLPFTPEKVFFISEKQSCWRYGDIQEDLENYLNTKDEPHIVLFAAGAYSCTCIWKMWSKGIKDHYLLDIGSILDPYLFGRNTRGYHKKLSHTFESMEQYKEIKKQENEEIPKVIHFVWVKGNVPICGQDIVERFKSLNPNYEIKIHDITSLDKKYEHIIPNCTRPCQQADLIRASVLEHEGGWYFDIDMYPFSSVDEIIENYKVKNFFISKQRDGRVNNACIGSIKNHSIWKSFEKHVNNLTEYSRTSFGPDCFTEIVPDDIVCNDAAMFYPIDLRKSAHNVFNSMHDKNEFSKHIEGIKNRTKGRVPHMLHLWGLPRKRINKDENINKKPHEKTYENIFTNIYKTNKWRFGSGAGSLKKVCTNYIEYITKLIKRKNIKSVLDIGCGDWQFSEDIDWGDSNYLGIDVVKYLMEENQKKYGSDKINFKFGDVHSIEIENYDLILIKEVFIHLPNSEIEKILKKISGKCKFLIISNPIGKRKNRDIIAGSYRPLDMTKEPFNLKGQTLNLFTRKDIESLIIENFYYEI